MEGKTAEFPPLFHTALETTLKGGEPDPERRRKTVRTTDARR